MPRTNRIDSVVLSAFLLCSVACAPILSPALGAEMDIEKLQIQAQINKFRTDCADRAERLYKQRYELPPSFESNYRSHYNLELGKCFLHVTHIPIGPSERILREGLNSHPLRL